MAERKLEKLYFAELPSEEEESSNSLDLKIQKFVVGQEKTNCYIVSLESGETIIIDPGDDAAMLVNEIQKINKVRLKYILLTHGHFDHVMAVDDLVYKYPGVSLIIDEKDVKLLASVKKQGEYWGKSFPDVSSKATPVSDGSTLPFGSHTIEVLETPGHTKGSVCFKIENNLFSGDTIFYHTYGRIDLPWSSPADMKDSIGRVLALPKETNIYPGHGKETTVEEESK